MKNNLKTNLIKALYFAQGQSCNTLGQMVNASIPVITRALGELAADGVVTEMGYAPSSGGRRPIIYGLNADKFYILTVAMDQLSTRIGMVNLRHDYVSKVRTINLPLTDNSCAAVQLAGLLNSYVEESGFLRKDILGAGIGMPGFVNVNEGINHSYLPTTGTTLVAYLEEQIALPVYIDNDSSLTALAELRFGHARQKKNAMVINIGWGIGLGMVLNGTLFRGYNGFAGEFSHIPLADGGALCACGKQGCLEAEASLLVVVKKVIPAIPYLTDTDFGQNCDALFRAAKAGDALAIGLLKDAGYKIGKAVAILIHIMNPERIILSGRGADASSILVPQIERAIKQYCIPRMATGTTLLVSELGFEAELIGGAVLVMENLKICADRGQGVVVN